MNPAGTQKIRILLAAATLIPIGVLAWLSLRIVTQERDLERQRARERVEVAAGRLAISMESRLAEIEKRFASGEGLRWTPSGISAPPETPLLYQPVPIPRAAGEPPPSAFAAVEVHEFQKQDLGAAAAGYATMAASRDPAMRAAALVRLARVHRKLGDRTAALEAYERLKQLGEIPTGGEPAEFTGRQGRAKVFEESGASRELAQEAAELAQIAYSGKFSIDRPTFGFYSELLQRWGAPPPPVQAVSRTESALRLWRLWRDGELPPRGRRVLREEGVAMMAVWEQAMLWVAPVDELHAWLTPLAESQQLRFSISDVDGHILSGDAPGGGVSLTPAETGLPFVLRVAALDAPRSPARTVLVSGLILALVLMTGAAGALYRVTSRELSLARQQSDFVSAVSHEFRTPLTSMRHLTELLASRGVADEERKQQYYELIAHETERLHRMVETLLSFGRIEAGAYAWQLQPEDVGSLVRGIVEEFRREPDAAGREIVCDVAAPAPSARVDREAFSRALWNLLENAAKYSDSGKPIQVCVRRQESMVFVGVKDQGAGIALSEQATIFQKFVRGSDAKRAGVRGVGIGLALVQRIVEAHGGTVHVESEPGRGSTFTLVIPCLES